MRVQRSIVADDVTGAIKKALLVKRVLNYVFFDAGDSFQRIGPEELTAMEVGNKLVAILGGVHKLQVPVLFALGKKVPDDFLL